MTKKTRLAAAADLLRQGRLADARIKVLKELRLSPQSATALELLGAITFEMGRHGEAIDHLRRAVRLAPSSPGPTLNLGKALFEAGRTEEAAALLADAVRRWPEIPEGRFFYANALIAQYERAQAIEEYRAAIRLAPNHVGAYENLATVLAARKDHEAARDVAERLLRLSPNSAVGQFVLAACRQVLCSWDGHDARLASVTKLVEQGRPAGGLAFSSMWFWDDAALHRRAAELESGLYAYKLPPPPKLSARKSGRIRLAYVSADFRKHPTSRLIPGLIEGHDRDRFEVIGISLGRDDGSAERQRMAKAFDQFLDLRKSPTDAIVRTMRDMQVDIAVDLMVLTSDCRPRLFLERVAPIQVNYLGFPGTSGTNVMDYIIVDPFIAAGGLHQTSTEKLAILPHCYQCNDALEQPPAVAPSRASCGLPEHAFVFCSFNGAQKLTPEVFDVWMRILHQVDGSVLWLLEPSPQAIINLRSEAALRGVDPARIHFAGRTSNDAHIARNAVPDLHLDTFPYNAHTTASDCLRAGAPILTRSGSSLPARVCGSLLATIGVPELITSSVEEYEALAVRLARDRTLLSSLRHRIEHGRVHSPLFDTARFCRDIELAFEAMVSRSRAGLPPAEIDVRTLA